MTKHKSKYVKRKLKKYSEAGMYDANVLSAAGKSAAGATESIVYDEADPKVLEAAKNAKLQNDETLAKNANTAAQDIKSEKEADEAAIEENAMKSKANAQQVDNTVGKSVSNLTDDGKSLDVVKNVGTKVKDGVASVREAAINIGDKTKELFKSKATKLAEAAAKKKLREETTKKLAEEAAKKQAALMAKEKLGEVAIDKTKDVVVDKTKDVITKKATDKLVEKGTEKLVEKGTEELIKKGGEVALKETSKGLIQTSVNPNPYATAANLAGTAISMGSDDGDATTWNAGEASGDILAKAGSYAGYGAMLGSAVPVIGNAAGALVGATIGAGVATYQGLANRKKARKEKQIADLKAQNKADETNAKTTKNFMSQMSNTRAAELKAKTYSGYDLGNNVSARRGGFRNIPKYV